MSFRLNGRLQKHIRINSQTIQVAKIKPLKNFPRGESQSRLAQSQSRQQLLVGDVNKNDLFKHSTSPMETTNRIGLFRLGEGMEGVESCM